jgi:uncharacterized protein YehS (DUF1456 family)
MINNDVLKKLRYILDYGDSQMIETFGLGQLVVTREKVSQLLKKDDDSDYVICKDVELSSFLNGLIIQKRGQKDGVVPVAEKKITNNITFKKLIIAFNLKSEGVIDVLKLADLTVGKSELSAFFRKTTHKNYRECKAQILRNFLMGLQIKERN